jgi:hypothetical protein
VPDFSHIVDPPGAGPFFHAKGHPVDAKWELKHHTPAAPAHAWRCKTCGMEYDPDEVHVESELPAPVEYPSEVEAAPGRPEGEHMAHQVGQAARWRSQADDAVRTQFSSPPKGTPVPVDLVSEYGHVTEPHPGIWRQANGTAPEGHVLDVANKLVGYTHFTNAPSVRELDARDLYRSYKHTPHAPASVFLKYLVHRHNHLAEYDDPARAHALDVHFLDLVQQGKAGEKNGHVTISHLHDWTRRWAPTMMPKLLDIRDRVQASVRRGIGLGVRSINGEPYVALTRGLDSEMMMNEHPLSSHANNPAIGFGSVKHHSWVPLKDIWYSYDLGDQYSSGTMGPEEEWLVSNTTPRYQATPQDVKFHRVQGFSNFIHSSAQPIFDAIHDDASDEQLAAVVRYYDEDQRRGVGAVGPQVRLANIPVPSWVRAHRNAGPAVFQAMLEKYHNDIPPQWHETPPSRASTCCRASRGWGASSTRRS